MSQIYSDIPKSSTNTLSLGIQAKLTTRDYNFTMQCISILSNGVPSQLCQKRVTYFHHRGNRAYSEFRKRKVWEDNDSPDNIVVVKEHGAGRIGLTVNMDAGHVTHAGSVGIHGLKYSALLLLLLLEEEKTNTGKGN